MSPKKKKPVAAQNLIDSLLDEKQPPAPPGAKSNLSIVDPGNKRLSDEFSVHINEFEDKPDFGKPSEDTQSFANTPVLLDINNEESFNLALTDSTIGKVPDPIAKASKESKQLQIDEDDVTFVKHIKKALPQQAPKPAQAKPKAHHDEDSPTDTAVVPAGKKLEDSTMQIDFGPKGARPQPSSLEEPTLQNPKRSQPAAKPAREEEPSIDRMMPTEVMKRGPQGLSTSKPQSSGGGHQHHSPGFSSAEAALKQSENLRIAQARITELEQELERVRRENEQLASAGETLRRRSDELLSKVENLDMHKRESEKIFDEEKKVVRGQMMQKDREIHELRGKVEEMENRLESSFKKIRVRERELEHRLEIIKMESATLVSAKDKMILELKRQIDQLAHENDYGKQKSQELFNQYKDKQETIRRVVRALRIALTILEGDEDSSSKKTE